MCVFHCLPLQNMNVKSPEFACKPDGNPTENYGSFHSELTQHCSRTLSWSRRGPANREILNKITNSFLGDVFFNVAVRLLNVLKFKPDTAQCSTMRVRRNRVRDFYIIYLKPLTTCSEKMPLKRKSFNTWLHPDWIRFFTEFSFFNESLFPSTFVFTPIS